MPWKESKLTQAMGGNLKVKKAGHSVNVYMTNEQVDKLNNICEEMGVQRNKYLGLILEHYWTCKSVKPI